MLRRTLSVMLVVGLLGMSFVPLGDALSHRAKYTATGVAYSGTTVYGMDVEWHGDCILRYTVKLKDAVTGAVVEQRNFRGFQDHTHPQESPAQPAELHQDVHGYDLESTVSFDIRGHMVDGVNNYPNVHYFGDFRGTYNGLQVVLFVVPGPWTLC